MPFCFVMQPFDGADFDRRYDEIYRPAIEAAGFEPYRVDRDPSATIPIDSIENGIRRAVACFVDITNDNPNVWFELGYAICAKKPLCLIRGSEREKFPFDIQHRRIIRYQRGSPRDFDALRANIIERLKAIQAHDNTLESIVKEPVSAPIGTLDTMEFSALCVVFENQESNSDVVSVWSINNEMERAGYAKIATKIALRKLTQRNMVEIQIAADYQSGEQYNAYTITSLGEEYILRNTERIKLKKEVKTRLLASEAQASNLSDDDDIPF